MAGFHLGLIGREHFKLHFRNPGFQSKRSMNNGVPTMPLDQKVFISILQLAAQNKVSDIHLRAGSAPAFRISGKLVEIKAAPLTDQDMGVICQLMAAEKKIQVNVDQVQDLDGSFEVRGLSRFRFNIFRHNGHLGAVLRLIPAKIPSLDEMKLPPVLKKFAAFERGLVLVTGATGSGKSSTLAAIINEINATRNAHILTIEDPVEFQHQNKMARITQREIGRDTGNFSQALKSALRQDPDVILVGEMRDPETIDIALKAAETGHMVFSTVHTTDAAKTVSRLLAVFPPEEQQMVRIRLSECLQGTISQRLLRRADGQGRIAAQEIMICNTAIRECIADPKQTANMPEFIRNGKETLGSQTFDQCLVGLYQNRIITLEMAREASPNPADFERNLMFGSNSVEKTGSGGQRPAMAFDSVSLDRGEEAAAEATPAEATPETGGPAEESVVVQARKAG